jgi:hypothetical protein
MDTLRIELGPWVQFPECILLTRELSDAAKVLYGILLRFDHQEKGARKGYIWPSINLLAIYTNKSRRRVFVHLAELEAWGAIRTQHAGRLTHRYLAHTWGDENVTHATASRGDENVTSGVTKTSHRTRRSEQDES